MSAIGGLSELSPGLSPGLSSGLSPGFDIGDYLNSSQNHMTPMYEDKK